MKPYSSTQRSSSGCSCRAHARALRQLADADEVLRKQRADAVDQLVAALRRPEGLTATMWLIWIAPLRARHSRAAACGVRNHRHDARVRDRRIAQSLRHRPRPRAASASSFFPAGARSTFGRVAELGDVRLFEGDPGDAAVVHAVVLGEDAADPHARGHRVGAHGHALAFERARRDLVACCRRPGAGAACARAPRRAAAGRACPPPSP
jgi:hypothetical protein